MRRNILKLPLLAPLLVLGITVNIFAAGGVLDPSFNGTGKSIFNIESSAVSGAFGDVVVISGNKFLVAGSAAVNGPSNYAVTLSRFNSDGSLDTSFGSGGKMITDIGVNAQGVALATQSDGKVVVAAFAGTGGNRMLAVLRYTPDGVLDQTFATNGVFISTVMKVAKDMTVLADDKILIAGTSDVPNFSRNQVLKLNANGSLDTAFGNNGITESTYLFGSDADKMVVQGDGKIVVSGRNLATVSKWLIHRFNSDGSPDMTFGSAGIREVNLSGSMHPGGLVLQPDGKIVLSGFVTVSGGGSNTQLLLARLLSDGTGDVSFGGGGFVFRDPTTDYDRSHHLTRTSDGRLIVAGQYDDGQAMLASFDSTGAIDTGFGTEGILLMPATRISGIALQSSDLVVIGDPISGMYVSRVSTAGSIVSFRSESVVNGKNDTALDVAIQPDGKIVSAGASAGGSGGSVVSVARQLPNGSLDPTFGTGGRVTFSDGTSYSLGWAVAIQPDGKIVVAGEGSQATTFTYHSLIVARLNADGSLDNTFGTGGKTIITNPRNLIGYDMRLQPDGKIVVAGTVYRVVGDGLFDFDMIAVRFDANGTLDANFGGGIFMYINGSAGNPSTEQAKTLAIQPDGKIVLAGTHMLRLNPDSSIDGTFSSAPVPLNFTATDIRIQTDGKLLVSGSMNTDFAIARFLSSGIHDPNFGVNGTAFVDFGGMDSANGILVDRSGNTVAGGSTLGGDPNRNRFALARLKPNGTLDIGFGNRGKVITDLGGDASIFGVAEQSDGKTIAAGSAKISLDRDYAIARYFTRTSPFDFDGDLKTDMSIFRPAVGEWWLLRSFDDSNAAFQFGNSADVITPADFTGDGKTDVAFFRPSTGQWFVLRSEDNSYYAHPFGLSTDIPAPGDFDADAKADEAVFRPSTGTWYVAKSSGGTIIEQFGQTGDVPMIADYDGDGIADIAVWRGGEWWIKRSSAGLIAFSFGNSLDKPVPGDYTGDGKADVAFWRPSTGQWFILRSEDFSYYATSFGTSGDVPAPGDYDGDGRHDPTVFRPATGTWYSNRTTAGTLIRNFGANGDRPVPNAYVP